MVAFIVNGHISIAKTRLYVMNVVISYMKLTRTFKPPTSKVSCVCIMQEGFTCNFNTILHFHNLKSSTRTRIAIIMWVILVYCENDILFCLKKYFIWI